MNLSMVYVVYVKNYLDKKKKKSVDMPCPSWLNTYDVYIT